MTILGNNTLLRYFRNFNNTTINEKNNFLENQNPEKITLSTIEYDNLSILHLTVPKYKRT